MRRGSTKRTADEQQFIRLIRLHSVTLPDVQYQLSYLGTRNRRDGSSTVIVGRKRDPEGEDASPEGGKRRPTQHISLNSDEVATFMVSTIHASFNVAGRGGGRGRGKPTLTLTDLCSTNGTHVYHENEHKLGWVQLVAHAPEVLSDGDLVSFGLPGEAQPHGPNPYVFRVEFEREPGHEPELQASDDDDATSRLEQECACAICLDPICACHVLPCGHGGCGECLYKMMTTTKVDLRCMTCRAKITVAPVPFAAFDRVLECAMPSAVVAGRLAAFDALDPSWNDIIGIADEKDAEEEEEMKNNRKIAEAVARRNEQRFGSLTPEALRRALSTTVATASLPCTRAT